MFDDKKLDKDTRIKYLTSGYYAGFGLWWALLLMGALLPDAYITNDGRMYLVLTALAYALVVIGATFWSGYSRRAREISNADPTERRNQLEDIRWSWLGMFVLAVILRLLTNDEPWYEAILFALFFSSFAVGFRYLVTLRKPKRDPAKDQRLS
jgi:hypothetical protein